MAKRSLTVRFEGPDISVKGVPLDDLVGVFEHLQNAVRRMAEYRALKSNSPTRMADLFTAAGTLRLRGVHQGSLVAQIELAEPEKLIDLGSDALDEVMAGFENPFDALPIAVAREVAEIPRTLHPDVQSVTISGGRQNRVVRISRDKRFIEPRLLAPETERTTVFGRILEVDWNDRTAELHSPGGVIPLAFTEEQGGLLYEHARQHVRVSGIATIATTGRITRLAVRSVAAPAGDDTFWEPSIAEEIKAQGVRPFEVPDDIELREDTDADEFLTAIFAE